jgi:hypothetical protein
VHKFLSLPAGKDGTQETARYLPCSFFTSVWLTQADTPRLCDAILHGGATTQPVGSCHNILARKKGATMLIIFFLWAKDKLFDLLHPGLREWLADLEDCGVTVLHYSQ